MRSFTFDLIKTLSSSEKAYVKQQIGSSGKHLLQLFIDLSKCKKYNKDAFIKNNKGESYIINLSQNQTYLRKKIIEALINYRAKSVYEIDMHNLINEILILIEKAFYKEAKTILDRGLKKAEYVEDYISCYNLCTIIFDGIYNNVYISLSEEEIKNYDNKRLFYLSQINKIENFRKLRYIYSEKVDVKIKLNKYKDKFINLGVSDKNILPKDYPFVAKRMFYFSKAQISILEMDTTGYIQFIEKIIQIYKEQNQFIKQFFAEFLGDSVNFLNCLIEIEDFPRFFEEHKIITDFISVNEKKFFCNDKSLIYVIKYYFLLTAYNNAKHHQKSVQFVDEYKTFINENKSKLSVHFIARSSVEIALTHLYNQQYEQTITLLEPAIGSKDYYSQYVGRILKILAHYTLKDEFLLDSLFQSFFHYLKTVDKKDQIPNIRILKKHAKNNTLHQLKNEDFEDFVYIHWDLFEKV